MEEYEIELCAHGYHVYKDVWTAVVGELLVCKRDQNNVVCCISKKDGNIVGHLPKKILCVYSIFLRQGGNVQCAIVARRRCSSDLPQGGLEIPCLLETKKVI